MPAKKLPKKLPPDVLEFFREQGSAGGKKSADALSPEERSQRARNATAGLTPEERSERAKLAVAAREAKRRSNRAAGSRSQDS